MRVRCSASIRQILVKDFDTVASLLTLFAGVEMAEIQMTLVDVQAVVFLRRVQRAAIHLTSSDYARIAAVDSFAVGLVVGFLASRGSRRLVGRSSSWAERLRHRVEAGLLAHCSRKPTGLKPGRPNWKQNSKI